MSSAPPSALAPEEIARDATWLAQALDPSAGIVRLVAMDRDSYRAASFLDDRLMQQPIDAQLVAWPEVEAAVDGEFRTDGGVRLVEPDGGVRLVDLARATEPTDL